MINAVMNSGALQNMMQKTVDHFYSCDMSVGANRFDIYGHVYLSPYCILMNWAVSTTYEYGNNNNTLHNNPINQQITSMLATSKNVLFAGHNHLLMTLHLNYCPTASEGDYQSEWSLALVVIRWLLPGIRIFLEVVSMAVSC